MRFKNIFCALMLRSLLRIDLISICRLSSERCESFYAAMEFVVAVMQTLLTVQSLWQLQHRCGLLVFSFTNLDAQQMIFRKQLISSEISRIYFFIVYVGFTYRVCFKCKPKFLQFFFPSCTTLSFYFWFKDFLWF